MIAIPRFKVRKLKPKEWVATLAVTVGLVHLYIMLGITMALSIQLQMMSWFLLYLLLLTIGVTIVAYRYIYKPMGVKDD